MSCTLFPQGSWGGCCDLHDAAYEKGGTSADRKAADCALRDCVIECGHSWIAKIMYLGVRVFGSNHWPGRPRWDRMRRYRSGRPDSD